MRIGTKWLFDTQRDAIADRKTRLFEIQSRISSGMKLERPSDEPAEFSKARGIEVNISKASQDLKDADEGITLLKAQDSILGKAEDVLARARDIAMLVISTSFDKRDMPALKVQLENLIDEAISYANWKFKGKYIFGGLRTSAVGNTFVKPYEDTDVIKVSEYLSPNSVSDPNIPLKNAGLDISRGYFTIQIFNQAGDLVGEERIDYDPAFDSLQDVVERITSLLAPNLTASVDGNRLKIVSDIPGQTFSLVGDTGGLIRALGGGDSEVEYKGTEEGMFIEVAGAKVEVTTPGERVFGNPLKPGDGILNSLYSLKSALELEEEEGLLDSVRSALSAIERSADLVAKTRAGIGSRAQILDGLKSRIYEDRTDLEINLSEIQDLDMPEAFVDFSLREAVMQAAMVSAVRMFELSILRFI